MSDAYQGYSKMITTSQLVEPAAIGTAKVGSFLAVTLALLNAAACATIAHGPPRVQDTPLTATRLVRPTPERHVEVTQEGLSIEAQAVSLCEAIKVAHVSRRKTYERINQSSGADWYYGIAGGALVAAGVATAIDSTRVYSADTHSRTYNPIGKGGALGIGIGLAVLGVAGLAVPTVDAVRASGEDVDVTTENLGEQRIGEPVPCNSNPVPGVALSLVVSETRVPLGLTNAEGRLQVQLEAVVPEDTKLSAGTAATVMDGRTAIGQVSLEPLYKRRDEAAWQKADRMGCKYPQTSSACASIQSYIHTYPAGAHANQAVTLLESVRPLLTGLADTETWIRVAPDKCAKPKTNDSGEVEGYCKGLSAYLEQFPSGEHATEARAALEVGTKIVAKLKAAEERKQKAEEAAEALKQKQAEQKAAWIAAQARAARVQAIRNECSEICSVTCSRRFDSGLCLKGCVPLCVREKKAEEAE